LIYIFDKRFGQIWKQASELNLLTAYQEKNTKIPGEKYENTRRKIRKYQEKNTKGKMRYEEKKYYLLLIRLNNLLQ